MRNWVFACLLGTLSFGCNSANEFTQETNVLFPNTTEEVGATDLGPGFTHYENKEGSVRLGVKKEMLGEELLFLANAVDHSEQPSWNGLRSRIITLEKMDGKIHMFERTNPDMNLQEDRTFLMTSFEIVRETEDTVFISFHEGMDELFYTSDWTSAGDEEPGFASWVDTWAWPTDDGFIASMERQGDYTVINHIFNVENQDAWSLELIYALTKYQPDPDYPPMAHPYTLDRMGFFATHALFAPNDVHDRQYVSRWNPANKVTWAISANTPPEYRQAVYDGINYWNRALGRTGDNAFLEIIDGPEGVVAPHYGYNMVQWVPNDSAGAAYADAQMDPRTGETLHANVFMASAFVAGGKSAARRIIRRIHGTLDHGNSDQHVGLQFDAWSSAKRCHFEYAQAQRDGYTQLLSLAENDAQILQVSQDYLREVVAHEIGHNLGLRHNFAGSTAARFDFHQRNAMFEAYVDEGDYPADAVGSSSVMDYSRFVEATMAGGRMRRNLEPGMYDILMTRMLYNAEIPTRNEIPLFCTDDHVWAGANAGIWQDCKKWDVGASPLVPGAVFGQTRLRNAAYYLLEDFIWEKLAEDYLLDEFPMTPSEDASGVFRERADTITALEYNAVWLGVERSFAVVDETNTEEYKEAMKTFINSEIESIGGLNQVFFPVQADWKSQFITEFTQRINEPTARSGMGWNDLPYEFTDADIDIAMSRAERYADKYFEALTVADVTSLMPLTTPFSKGLISDSIEAVHTERQNSYLFTQALTSRPLILEFKLPAPDNPETLISTSGELPRFAYPDAARLAALSLLSAGFSENPDFGKAALEDHAVMWKNLMESAYDYLSFDPETLDMDAQNTEVQEWFTTQSAITEALSEYLPEPVE